MCACPARQALRSSSSCEAHGIGVPIILMTGDADAGLDQKAAHLGVSALLRKPVTETVMLDAIERATAASATRKL